MKTFYFQKIIVLVMVITAVMLKAEYVCAGGAPVTPSGNHSEVSVSQQLQQIDSDLKTALQEVASEKSHLENLEQKLQQLETVLRSKEQDLDHARTGSVQTKPWMPAKIEFALGQDSK